MLTLNKIDSLPNASHILCQQDTNISLKEGLVQFTLKENPVQSNYFSPPRRHIITDNNASEALAIIATDLWPPCGTKWLILWCYC